jgi:hypothetical protein
MRMTSIARTILIAVALMLAAPSFAADLHRGHCHMDICTWYSVEQKEPAGSNAHATLFKVTLKTWTSTHKGGNYQKKAPLTGEETNTFYYNCSKAKPAIIESQGGKWTASFLDLANPAGFAELAVMEYFVVCHGFDVDKPNTRFDVAAHKFGYRKVSDTPDSIELNKPEDILR